MGPKGLELDHKDFVESKRFWSKSEQNGGASVLKRKIMEIELKNQDCSPYSEKKMRLPIIKF